MGHHVNFCGFFIGLIIFFTSLQLILLKKKLNQAKIQIIHKLTRKAKTFVEKKAPEKIKEKLKRKAEAAVNEVLIIKVILNALFFMDDDEWHTN